MDKQDNQTEQNEVSTKSALKIIFIALGIGVLIGAIVCAIAIPMQKANDEKASAKHYNVNYVQYHIDDSINGPLAYEDGDPFVMVTFRIENQSIKQHMYQCYCEIWRNSDDMIIAQGKSLSIQIPAGESREFHIPCYMTYSWQHEGHKTILNKDMNGTQIRLMSIITEEGYILKQ